MTTISIHKFSAIELIQKLRKVNFTEEQAEVVAQAFEQQSEIVQQQESEIEKQNTKIQFLESKNPATKGDMEIIKGQIRETELRLQREIEVVRNQMIIWVFGMLIIFGGAIISIIAKGFKWW